MGNEIVLNKVFVVYYEEKPLQVTGRKTVYKSIGSARGVITEEAKRMAREVMNERFGSYYSYPSEAFEEEYEKQKQKFRIKNYMPLGVRQEVAWFGSEMEKQLAANDHKSGWKDENEGYFLYQIDLILDLLHKQALSPEEKIKKAADIANFAMMIADNAKEDK